MLTVGMLGHLSRIPRAKGLGSTVKGWGEEGRGGDVAPRAVYSTDTWRDEEQRAWAAREDEDRGGRYRSKDLMSVKRADAQLSLPILKKPTTRNHHHPISSPLSQFTRQSDDYLLSTIYFREVLVRRLRTLKTFVRATVLGKKNPPKDAAIGSTHHLCLSGGLRPLWGLPLSLTYLIRPLKLINMNASRGRLKAFLRKEGRREREEKHGGVGGRGFLCLRTMSWWLFKPLSGSGLIPRAAVMG